MERIDISADALIAAERAERYRVQLERPNTFPTEQNWQYIIECKMAGIAPQLYRKFLLSWLTDPDIRTDYHLLALKYFPEYINAIDRKTAVRTVYDDVRSSPQATLSVITGCRLFDASRLMEILADEDAETDPAPFVADCMAAYQPGYDMTDLRNMQALYSAVKSLPPIGELKETRSIFGREMRYICPHGHPNPADSDFCQVCGINKYGFNEAQAAAIENFRLRLTLLERMLREH